MQDIQLLIIDAQNDFCDLPEHYCPEVNGIRYQPSLPVPGSHQDCLRIARFIQKSSPFIHAIDAFMDTHQYLDIGHHGFWLDAEGQTLKQMNKITLDDVLTQKYRPKIQSATDKIVAYFEKLHQQGLDAIYTWPVHCQIGTWGHNIHPDIIQACSDWESNHLKWVNYIQKGEDPWSEHYSALKAEVANIDQPASLLKQDLVNKYARSALTLFAGEAASHCVSKTITDVVNNIESKDRKKMIILSDCMSAIPGYEQQTQDFFQQMANLGVRISDSEAMFKELSA